MSVPFPAIVGQVPTTEGRCEGEGRWPASVAASTVPLESGLLSPGLEVAPNPPPESAEPPLDPAPVPDDPELPNPVPLPESGPAPRTR